MKEEGQGRGWGGGKEPGGWAPFVKDCGTLLLKVDPFSCIGFTTRQVLVHSVMMTLHTDVTVSDVTKCKLWFDAIVLRPYVDSVSLPMQH